MRVLIIDDHALIAESSKREVLRLRPSAEIRCAACLAQAQAVLEAWATPDAVMLDLGLPDANGMAGLSRIRELLPHTRIAVVSGDTRTRTMADAFSLGADAFLKKSLDIGEWQLALELFLDTGSYVPKELATYRREAWPPPALQDLSPRQREALILMAKSSRRIKQLASDMGVSENTFATYYKAAYKKLGIRSRLEAVERLEELGALERRAGTT